MSVRGPLLVDRESPASCRAPRAKSIDDLALSPKPQGYQGIDA
jgi:hypothetical protein